MCLSDLKKVRHSGASRGDEPALLVRNAVIVGFHGSARRARFRWDQQLPQRRNADCDVCLSRESNLQSIPNGVLTGLLRRFAPCNDENKVWGRITSREQGRVGAALTTISH